MALGQGLGAEVAEGLEIEEGGSVAEEEGEGSEGVGSAEIGEVFVGREEAEEVAMAEVGVISGEEEEVVGLEADVTILVEDTGSCIPSIPRFISADIP